MASLQEIAGSLNIDIPERERKSSVSRKNLGQKRRSWLAEDEQQQPAAPAEKPAAAPEPSQPEPATETKPASKPSTAPETPKQAEPGWQPFVWPTEKV